jgi:phosphopentomutase
MTLYAHYATDTAGHERDIGRARVATERLDRFLAAVIDGLPQDLLLVVASDHGNLEDVTAGHTRNPALGLVAGSGHADLAGALNSLMDVTPTILRHLVVRR